MINQKTLTKLEYAAVLDKIAQKTHSIPASTLVRKTLPSCSVNEVRSLLQYTQEAVEYINNAVTPDFTFDDITTVLEKARVCSTLTMRELLGVMRLLRTSQLLKNTLNSYRNEKIVLLSEMAQQVYINTALQEEIDYCIISDEEMNDRASPALFTIRKKIKKANADIREKLTSYTKSKDLAPYLQDAIVTMRGGRYVIPVKQEYKGFVKGLVHDQSASGSTVFIEPLAIVNLNNEIKSLMLEESEEIERILANFTQQVNAITGALHKNQEVIAQLDSIFARANYAIDIRAICPTVNDTGYINLIKARHPLLNKDKTVPISVSLGTNYRIIVITGPNTGGKTVSLKTIGLFCIMACSGMFISAEDGSEVCCFEDIFVDIGDEQSIEQSLSTFSSHMTNIRFIIENVTRHSLVLLDELGGGTEPNEGSALALALTQFLLDCKCRAVITTHYAQLKEYALTTDAIENASMEFNPKTFEPTYKLILGIPGSSNAIEIASRLGIPPAIIDNARSKLSTEKISFENVLRHAEEVRQQNEQQREEVLSARAQLNEQLDKAKSQNRLLMEERDKLLKKSQAEVRQVVREAQERADALVDELKKIIDGAEFDESTLFKARSIVKQISNVSYTVSEQPEQEDYLVGEQMQPADITIGASVYVKSFKSQGKITAIDLKKGKATIAIGRMSTIVKLDDLFYAHDVKVRRAVAPAITKIKTTAPDTEINLLGQTVGEAIENVDRFLDQAALSGLKQVRVVHGIGTGRLREGIRKHLAKHTLVEDFRYGEYGEGESGVTIVRLK